MEHSSRPLVCIVDDEATTTQLLEFILGINYDTCRASSGTEALTMIRDRQPDLVLLDIMMPDMDGLDVCDQLKASPDTASIPVIFVTGLEESGDQAKGFEAGAVDYIAKPLSPPVVRARVSNVLQRRQYVDVLESLLADNGHDINLMRSKIRSVLNA